MGHKHYGNTQKCEVEKLKSCKMVWHHSKHKGGIQCDPLPHCFSQVLLNIIFGLVNPFSLILDYLRGNTEFQQDFAYITNSTYLA